MDKEIERYYNKVKDLYPQLTKEEFQSIIVNTFKYFRSRMASNDIPDVRLKGFGSFQVFAAPVLQELRRKKKIVDLKGFTSGRNFDYVKKLENYVEKNSKLFDEYYKKRKKST